MTAVVDQATPQEIPRTPRKVTKRGVHRRGGVVKLRVPAGASEGTYTGENGTVRFLRFPRNIRGGFVNFFVHTSDDLRGKKISARVSVLKITYEDGMEYLYLDFIPVSDTEQVTHQLLVMSQGDVVPDAEADVIETPEPLSGLIVLTKLKVTKPQRRVSRPNHRRPKQR